MAKRPKLVKKFIVYSEMVAAGKYVRHPNPKVIDEISLVYEHRDGGCKWAFSIRLERLAKPSMQLRMWADSWEAFDDAQEIPGILAKFRSVSNDDDSRMWPLLLPELRKWGWKHVKAKGVLQCRECGKPRE